MPRQPDHPHVMAEILAAELRADAEPAGQLEHLLLEPAVAVGLAVAVALDRQRVEIAAAGELDRLQIHLGRSAADHDGEVVGRASGRAEGADFVVEELQQRLRVQHRPGLLIKEALVGGAAALGDEQKFVCLAGLGEEVDLRRKVVAGVDLLVHRQRSQLAVAQIGLGIGAADAGRECRGVVAVGPDLLALLAHDDRGAGVLAHRKHVAGGDIGVLQQIERDELVVGRGLRIVEDRAQLGEMAGAQQVRGIDEGLAGKERQGLGSHFDDAPALERAE